MTTASSELGSSDMLLHILAAIILLPTDGPRSPNFIQLLFREFGFQIHNLAHRLQTMRNIIWMEPLEHVDLFDRDICLSHSTYSTFTDFVFDQSCSNTFFIDKDYHSNFLAHRCLCLLQSDEDRQNSILYRNWARICSVVDNPSQELLSQLSNVELGDLIEVDSEDPYNYWSRWICNFHITVRCNFETISSWLKSQASDGIALPTNLIDHFDRIYEKGLHIRSRSDLDPAVRDYMLIILSIAIWKWSSSPWYPNYSTAITHLCRNMNLSIGLDYTRSELRSIAFKFCRCSTGSGSFDSECILSPIVGATDLYHVNIQAGCAQILKALQTDLQSTSSLYHVTHDLVLGVLTTLTQCTPRLELLPFCQIVLDVIGRIQGHIWRLQEHLDELSSWLESFPTDYANETETLKKYIKDLVLERQNLSSLYTSVSTL
ncbi:hypothetical protein E1B28_003040 [Marasmius oreades]|uniref:Uncharacterized protein n=1 Tax=Marasmius oreades TaxID=181124 RepID=A0A9P7RLR7_9AGAR|nr:uncharacterized protein E1B28_003040 [Marasmius oreades]KAG7085478.1 hypothetical protein E1B28_003040 [Marasmius oreades]